jgi:mannose-6-phosphate isomerase-like protein (cupin superfamily)
MPDRGFHHRPLPPHSSLLSGQRPEGWDVAWRSDRLQVLYNNTTRGWQDDGRHAHGESDEIFIVLEGTVVVDVDGERVEVGPGEFCCFPPGLPHAVIETRPPLRTFMLRAPSVDDKLDR